MSAISQIRIVGAGIMGRGIAHLAAVSSISVEIADISTEALTAGQEAIGAEFEKLVTKGRMSRADASAALGRIRWSDRPTAPSEEIDLVIEAIIEDLDAKSELLRELDLALPNALLASNTSALSIAELSRSVSRPGQIIGLHFFNPVPRMKLVEVVPSLCTDESTVARALDFIAALGHEPIIVEDTPGFMVNWLGRGLVTEALALLSENACTVEGLDDVVRDVLGLRMGPFELMDLTGLDVSHALMESIWSRRYADPRLRPSPVAAARVAAGLYGRKTGRGFHSYPAAGHSDTKGRTAVGAASAYSDTRIALQLPEGADVLALQDSSEPLDNATTVHVVLPMGEPAYRVALRSGLPVERTVGVDPLSLHAGGRLSISTPPTMSAQLTLAVVAELEARGFAVTVSPDGTAPIAQRILASIVNVAASIAESGCSSPADIDKGARLGLGYPRGPFELADTHGVDTVVEILDRTHDFTRDPRYRATGWLRTRAELGLASGFVPDVNHAFAAPSSVTKQGSEHA